jgi:hypothetical protein
MSVSPLLWILYYHYGGFWRNNMSRVIESESIFWRFGLSHGTNWKVVKSLRSPSGRFVFEVIRVASQLHLHLFQLLLAMRWAIRLHHTSLLWCKPLHSPQRKGASWTRIMPPKMLAKIKLSSFFFFGCTGG